MLGKEHVSTLTSMVNITLSLYRQRKYQEAEDITRRTLELCEVLGMEHPGALNIISNLALVQADKKEAVEVEGETAMDFLTSRPLSAR